MVKTLDQNSTYEPSKRSFKWLKLKKVIFQAPPPISKSLPLFPLLFRLYFPFQCQDYINNGLGDTFDLIPIAAFFGQGKRTGFYGSYLLAVYNSDYERYETLCKAGTGFSDEILERLYNELKEHRIKGPLEEYLVKEFKADVWFQPKMVWEIRGADIQISPKYTCAIADLANGNYYIQGYIGGIYF